MNICEVSDSEESSDYETWNEINIFKIKFINFSFQIIEEYRNIESMENLHLTCLNHKSLMLWGKKVYLLK